MDGRASHRAKWGRERSRYNRYEMAKRSVLAWLIVN